MRIRIRTENPRQMLTLRPEEPIAATPQALRRACADLLKWQYVRLGPMEMWLMDGNRVLAYARKRKLRALWDRLRTSMRRGRGADRRPEGRPPRHAPSPTTAITR